MAENSSISWTHSTWNPWRGCIEHSDGCRNCYARELVTKRQGHPELWGPAKTSDRLRTSATYWKQPLAWNKKAALAPNEPWRVFCGSLCDWAENHPTCEAIRPDMFQLIRATRNLTWLLCTKRSERLPDVLPPDWGAGYPNCWLIVSIEDMRVRDRADELRAVNAAVRAISYEPALGPLDDLDLTGIDWVICGAESGPNRRPYDLAWARRMRDRCAEAGITFHYKQGSHHRSGMFPELDGVLHHHFPTPRPLSWAPIFGGGHIAQGTFLV